MLQLVPSRTGPPTVVVRGVYLHSRYDPQGEADRYADRALAETRPSLILLLGAGLGYLRQALRRRAPDAALLPVFYDEGIHAAAESLAGSTGAAGGAGLAGRTGPGGSTARACDAWHPGLASSLLDHLRARVGDLDSEGMVILEWPASARLFPERSRQANEAVRQLLRELRGSLATTCAFGPRWLRNAFRNFVFMDRLVTDPTPPTSPVLIAASGPSLGEALPVLAPYRDRFCLWALPSSVLALLEQGLRPDLVLLTDPGYYAAAHLYPAAGRDLEIAMPLSAACGTWRVGASVRPLSHGTFFERALWKLRDLEPPMLPSLGTVAASAVTLARLLGTREVVVAGLDLCHRDIRSHVRPSMFDRSLDNRSTRLSPFHHRVFARHVSLYGPVSPAGLEARDRRSANLALETYAGWFAGLRRVPGMRLYRLLPSAVKLGAFTDLDTPAFRNYARALPPRRARKRRNGPAAGKPAVGGGDSQDAARRASRAAALLARWDGQLKGAEDRLDREGVRRVLSNSALLALCYYIDAASLAEAHRKLRLGGPGAAAEALHRLLSRSREFLGTLRCALGEE